jgi:dimeric dUTPase (all-alpha-NTP-PPase superfamily)
MIKQNKIDFNRNKLFDMVTRNEALEKMVTSLHCLLSIGNLNPSQLPSKIIEYISTGKPVLHFVEIKDDPVLEIAKEFSNLIVIDKNSNITEVQQQLNNVFINIEKFDINKFNENYSTRAVTNKLNII